MITISILVIETMFSKTDKCVFCSILVMIIITILMLISGVLLTTLSYRTMEMGKEWWEWTESFYKSEKSRLIGPFLIVISCVVLILVGVRFYLLYRSANQLVALLDEYFECPETNSSESQNGGIGGCLKEKDFHCENIL